MKRVPPSQRTKEEIRSLIDRGSEDTDPKSEMIRLGVRRIVEEAFEQLVKDVLGRDYYERRTGQEGSRNGYRTVRMKTAEGEVSLISFTLRVVSPISCPPRMSATCPQTRRQSGWSRRSSR